jgi:CDP-diacylglycerol---serine O-phosphatidyltransferase
MSIGGAAFRVICASGHTPPRMNGTTRALAPMGADDTVKKVAIIPTLLTLGNAVCGFAAIAYAGKIGLADSTPDTDNYYLALSGWLIVAAMVFDALDGYIARLARSTSKFGAELDSLCDAVSFGAAPAFLLLRMGPGWEQPLLHKTLAVVATLYMVCAILRLARYNVGIQSESGGSKKFQGLPSPAAAGCIASLAVLRAELAHKWPGIDPGMVRGMVEVWATLGALLVALLMVSQVPYPHLTKQLLRGRRHFNHLIQLVLAVFVLMLVQELALVVVFWGYALFILARTAWAHARHVEELPAPSLEEAGPR